MIDLAQLTPQSFEPLIGKDFVVMGPHGEVALSLDNIKHGSAATLRDASVEIDGVVLPPRQAFALTLEGPLEPLLASQAYDIRVPELGEMMLLLSPFRQDQNCTLYEIAFS